MRRLYYFNWRHEWPFAFGVAFILLVIYALTMPPGVTFEDTGLFVAVCHNGGISHPPGYPLHTLLCIPFSHLSDFLPINPAQASALLSVLAATLAAVLFYEIACRFWKQRLLAASLALALGLGERFWSQAIIPETYTLNALLVVSTLLFVLRFLRRTITCKPLFIAAFLAGLGLSNHWPLYLITAPAFALLAFSNRRIKRHLTIANSGRCLLLFLLGLSPYLYLLYRADFAPPPFAPLGAPTNVEEFIAHVGRASYLLQETAQPLALSSRVAYMIEGVRLVAWEYGLFGLVLAVIGVCRFFYRRNWNISVSVLYGALASAPLLGFIIDFHISDTLGRAIFSVYPLPAMPFVLIFIGEALVLFRKMAVVVAIFFILFTGITNWRVNDRSDDSLAEDYAAAVFAALPEKAVLITGNDFIFPLYYLRYARGDRTDLSIDMRSDYLGNSGEYFVMDGGEYSSGHRDYGIFKQLLPEMPKEHIEVAIPPSLLRYYGSLPALYDPQGNVWNQLAVRTAMLNASRALAILSTKTEFGDEHLALLNAMRIFPEGLLGEFLARASGQAKPYTPHQLRTNLQLLYAKEVNFPAQWQSLLRQTDAAYHISIGDTAGAQAILEEAVAIDTSLENPAAVDLLQLLAYTGDWHAYEKQRRRSVIKNNNLAAFDRQCAEALGRDC